jgi:hypothetical protein
MKGGGQVESVRERESESERARMKFDGLAWPCLLWEKWAKRRPQWRSGNKTRLPRRKKNNKIKIKMLHACCEAHETRQLLKTENKESKVQRSSAGND